MKIRNKTHGNKPNVYSKLKSCCVVTNSRKCADVIKTYIVIANFANLAMAKHKTGYNKHENKEKFH